MNYPTLNIAWIEMLTDQGIDPSGHPFPSDELEGYFSERKVRLAETTASLIDKGQFLGLCVGDESCWPEAMENVNGERAALLQNILEDLFMMAGGVF